MVATASMAMLAALTPKLTSYIPHNPTVKQAAFLLLPHREAFYGGAAGGGKSDALLMAALQYVDVPGYAAIIFRQSYPDLTLPNSIMARAEEWLKGTDARWVDREKTWYFPSGAKLAFGYMANERDKMRYKSAEFQFIGFDELTQFTQTMYIYLMSRLRRLKGMNVPLRMRSASNPGDIGHEWVRQRFVDYKPNIVPGSPSEVIFRTVRPFIRAKLSDNPYLDAEEYKENLNEMDPVTREQLLNGDWEIRQAGSKFKQEDFLFVDESEVPKNLQWVRYWDLAATEPKPGSRNKDPDFTAGGLVAYDGDTGDWYCRDMQHFREDPARTEANIMRTAEDDTIAVRIFMEQEPGASGKTVIDHFKRKVLVGFNFIGIRSTGNKEVRALIFSSAVGNHRFKLVRGHWNMAFIRECVGFPLGHDDQVDAISGAMQKIRKKKGIRPVGRTRMQIIREQVEQEIMATHRRLVIA